MIRNKNQSKVNRQLYNLFRMNVLLDWSPKRTVRRHEYGLKCENTAIIAIHIHLPTIIVLIWLKNCHCAQHSFYENQTEPSLHIMSRIYFYFLAYRKVLCTLLSTLNAIFTLLLSPIQSKHLHAIKFFDNALNWKWAAVSSFYLIHRQKKWIGHSTLFCAGPILIEVKKIFFGFLSCQFMNLITVMVFDHDDDGWCYSIKLEFIGTEWTKRNEIKQFCKFYFVLFVHLYQSMIKCPNDRKYSVDSYKLAWLAFVYAVNTLVCVIT